MKKKTTMKSRHSIQTRKFDLNKVAEVAFSDLSKLLSALNIEYTKSGTNYFFRCPIHGASDNDKAVCVSSSRKCWKCWTRSCHEEHGRDVFGFVRGVLSTTLSRPVEFSEALRFITDIYEITTDEIYRNNDTAPPVVSEYADINDIVKVFNRVEQQPEYKPIEIPTLKTSPYFESRGFSRETLKLFGVKDCVDRSSPLFNRAIIPVEAHDGKNIGYIARATKHYVLPKFLFSKGLNKSHHLYNYSRARDIAIDKASIIIVEGQGDVWRMRECGINNCVGLFGKEISDTQKDLLIRSGATTIVVLTDNDQAGRESKLDIHRKLSRLFKLVFPRFQKKDIGDMSIDQIQATILPQIKGLY